MSPDTFEQEPFATLDGILITNELERRSARPADFQTESQALSRLMAVLANRPANLLQELVEAILEYCKADSAGISILKASDDGEPDRFHWAAIAGPFASHAGESIPRHLGPCGVVVDRDEVLLFDRPSRHFATLAGSEPPVFEVLAAPFHLDGQPVGTVWAIGHSPQRCFDAEDARLLRSLSRFASAGHQAVVTMKRAAEAREKLNQEAEARANELAEVRRLQETSTRLIAEGNVDALLGEIQDAALAFTRTDIGTMQLVDAETGELVLLRSQGFPPEIVSHFQRVGPGTNATCAEALKRRRRVIAPDIQTSEIFAGTRSLELHLEAGVRAAQSTPLISRAGKMLGMLSTHWRHPHQPTEHELRLLDVLTRQVADLIERCQTEEALRSSETNLRDLSRSLEQQVAERTAELEEKNSRLRRLAAELASAEHRERKRLAALLHDDVQQLLVASKMQVGTLRTRLQGDPNLAVVEQLAELLHETADAARDLTRQLRPPALYEDGLIPALQWLASEMQARQRLEVAIEADGAGRALSDDSKALLFECVRELLFNVAKYAGVDRAVVGIRESKEHLHLRISDEGAGFDVATLAHKRSAENYGLFSIRERLLALGGDMRIESAPGMGTRVELEIPLERGDEDEFVRMRVAPLVPEGPLGGKRAAVTTDRRVRVLVADDHTLIREGIANILNEDERLLVVGQAADGIEAIQAVEKDRPQVVLMDINMPRKNGIEAAREITARWPDTVIIGLSVHNDDAIRKSILGAGAVAFLPKTGAREEMIEAIVKLSQKRIQTSRRD